MRKIVYPKLAVFLYDFTGVMAEPWCNAGWIVLLVDVQHPGGLHFKNNKWRIGADISKGFTLPENLPSHRGVGFVAAFPPCDHLAVSGARWFKGKGLRALEQSIGLFATASEFCEQSQAPYMIENPVSTISTYWRKPDYIVQPWHFSGIEPQDNYNKTTCLWVGGGFKVPKQTINQSLWFPDDRIHKEPPGPARKNNRSATPKGFAQAVYEANAGIV